MIASGYTLDLYCDSNESDHHLMQVDGHSYLKIDGEEHPHSFSNEKKQVCFRLARHYGWVISVKYGVALCPKCKAKGDSIRSLTRRDDERGD